MGDTDDQIRTPAPPRMRGRYPQQAPRGPSLRCLVAATGLPYPTLRLAP